MEIVRGAALLRSRARSAAARALRKLSRSSPWDNDDVLLEELFSIERLEQHAASLAVAQQVALRPVSRPRLAVRLRDNEAVLLSSYRALARAVDEGREVTPAAEWLLDNYHLVEAQIREIRQDLPPKFYRLLPKLAGGPFLGYPRVFGIAWAYAAHTDSNFEPESLRSFVAAYQLVQPLTIGELWAVAITLRIVLVENLRRAAHSIVRRREARQDADDVADRVLGVNGHDAEPTALIDRYEDAELHPSAAVQLVQRLRNQDPQVTPALDWLEGQLARQGKSADAVVNDEHQRQGRSNVTVRNIITSMRLISELDWSEFFESVSRVDERLRTSPGYSQMDFATRNLYRSAIEALSRRCKRTEIEVADAALAAAAGAAGDALDQRNDTGYHLIGPGRHAFESTVGYRAPLWRLPGRWIIRHGAGSYVGSILAFAGCTLALALHALVTEQTAPWKLGLLCLFGALPAIDIAVAFVNRAVTAGFGATMLPGLALREGVPASLRTLIAVPTMLRSAESIARDLKQLEVHHLASCAGEFHFALLSDWCDDEAESMPADNALLVAATLGIERLNRVYGPMSAGKRFMLLHRRRVWSESERTWMGWERKRGKLDELNRLLRGATDTTFVGGDAPAALVPGDVRYVITLDADTRLPREAARRLVGKMAHPLNRPRFDPGSRRIVAGYGILQPRVTPSLPMGGEGSAFQRILSSAPGIDPYAAAVSDVYQDLFSEGSYAGKGIYEVDAFEATLGGRAADGTLLSHDLFEGIFARAGLASDIEVIEEFPARYDVAAARQHRWTRGDWQLLPWLFGRRDQSQAQDIEPRMPVLGFWKIMDNLRRTLSAPANLAALAAGWLLPLHAALLWTGYILSTIALPTLLPVAAAIVPRNDAVTLRSHLIALTEEVSLALRQIGYQVTFLPHQAWQMLDAIGRTLYRLFISHRNLLEWMTEAQAAHGAMPGLAGFYRLMGGGLVAAALALAGVTFSRVGSVWLAAPFAVLWVAAPAMALWISRPTAAANQPVVTAAQAQALRDVARRTWRYFETFVTADNHALPPDNHQEDPSPVLARRTSPTNIGLYLLSTVAARDFGWLGTLEAVERLEATLATMGQLPRYRGHFYNWYGTADLRPLEPHYVSSVDSGNLAAHLIATANAAREWIEHPVPTATSLAGTRDTLRLARQAMLALPTQLPTQSIVWTQLEGQIDAIATAVGELEHTGHDVAAGWKKVAYHTSTLLDIARTLASNGSAKLCGDLLFWADATHRCIESRRRDDAVTSDVADLLNQRLATVARVALELARAMDFSFLLDRQRKLLSIGCRADDGSLDPSCYDLLASEARLASFVAIAKDDVETRHWFRLGRPVTAIGRGAALVSWSGSMFEYLMPSLVMRAPAASLLEQTSRLIVQRQVRYGAQSDLPWGISESAFNARDLEFTYQYSNFGVPGLGLKRGLSENSVVAPYATALAAMVEPGLAVENFARLAALGAVGRYGYYEALDYTRSRLPEGERYVIVRAFMAHHQGMTIVALANVLLDGVMRRRFHAEPSVRATELLLQERTPRDVSVAHPRAEDVRTASQADSLALPEVRKLFTTTDATPQAHMLSNGRYVVLVTGAGSGYSRWRDLGITRWREDATCDDSGSYIYLRDVESGRVWSAGYQPCGESPARYEVTFTEDKVEIARTDPGMTTTVRIIVSPEDDAEVRHVSITNTGNRVRDIEVTSYCELALAPPDADAAHPAFSKLFVQTEFVASPGALLATRRRRSQTETEVWAAHHAVVEGQVVGALEFETDRARFLGRGHGTRRPMAMTDGRRLSNTVGTVLDPALALRVRVRVPARTTTRVAFWTAVAESRRQVLDLVDKHRDMNAYVRAGTLAWTQAQVQLRHLGITAAEAGLFQRLAGHVLYADSSMRPSSDTIRRGCGGRAALWAQGISGDLPIVLLRIDDLEDIAIVRQLLQAHEYWRMKRLAVDLVILNERAASYVQDLQNTLESMRRMSLSRGQATAYGDCGSVFILRADMIPTETRALLTSASRVVLAGQHGSLFDQLERQRRASTADSRPKRHRAATTNSVAMGPAPADLEYFNGLGGFTAHGQEYVVLLGPGQSTPAPWINVIANSQFGFQVAAEGSGYTWSMNSRENQLTPWSNDPVTDRTGEAIYVRDDDTGELWSPTAAPFHDPDAFHTARHGQGYSRFEHASRGVALDLLTYVPLYDPIRISILTIRNTSTRPRRLSITTYAEWVLGPSRAASAPFVLTELDPVTGALFARNPWSDTFGGRVAFVDLAGQQTGFTADRKEFLGRHGSLSEPAALASTGTLSKRVGAGLDPCAALQTTVRLAPGAAAEIVYFMGEAGDAAGARALLQRYRSTDLEAVFLSVTAYWDSVLGVVEVKTPDRAMDILLNRWMLYQALACRLWARAAFYQASGAYGFRDQLQDAVALALSQPALARAHLLLAASRQFTAGDVQHWWLPPKGTGVRTRISDDRVWLAYAVGQYIQTTGDTGVLDVLVPFIEGQALGPMEHDAYFEPVIADEKASLFEHCARALNQSLSVGVHHLPLIGTGDWNDGMNRVGELGRGESVWLGWFLYSVLTDFARIAGNRGEQALQAKWHADAAALQTALESDGWDGEWYRRGYYDDGTPLGSATSDECRIDAIAQSWSVISGAADPNRAARAMAAVDRHLVQRDAGLALLFTPPFDKTPLEPGYIKGYPPGIRENGGQYNHAATWTVIAFAQLGEGNKAAELFGMINPVNRTRTRADVHRYKVEPYAVAADVYSVAPHAGRGGWTWYTGSAGWAYRAGLEAILGFHVEGKCLRLSPSIPTHWPGFDIVYRYRSTRYEIHVDNSHGTGHGLARLEIDHAVMPDPAEPIALVDDHRTHTIRVMLGPPQ